MALSTISAIKTELGISVSGEDTKLTAWLRSASYAIRAYTGRYLGGVITSSTAASPTVITSPGHGLETGDTVFIFNCDAGVSVNGSQSVTYVTDDTFSVAVDNTVGNSGSAATLGTYCRTLTEYYNGTGTPDLWLRERPVHSIASIYEDSGAYWGNASGAFASATQLTDGTDFSLMQENERAEESESGLVLRIGSVWPSSTRQGGTLVAAQRYGVGNIKVTYTAGYANLPWNIRKACHGLVEEMRLTAGKGGPMQSESMDYYTYQRMSASELKEQLPSVRSLLRKYKEIVV